MNSELPPNERPSQIQPDTSPQRQVGPFTGPVIGGIALVAIGGIMLVQTMGLTDRLNLNFNWWALFLLIPIFSIANSTWQIYQSNGEQLTREVRSKAVMAAILSVVFAALMFDLDWSRLWPVFLILGGLGILLGGSVSE
jgi:hypothetical protein